MIPGDPTTTGDTVLETSAVASWTIDREGRWTSVAPIHDLVHVGTPDNAETNRRIDVISDGYRFGSALLASHAAAASVISTACGALTDDIARSVLTRLAGDWSDEANSDLGALGIAHGAAGMAFAAVRLAHLPEDNAELDRWRHRLDTSSRAAVATSIKVKNHESVSWCRGMAGIVAAHLQPSTLGLNSPELPAWIDWLFTNHELALGHGLCCGAGSLADIIATMRHLRQPEPPSAQATLEHWLSQQQNPRLPATQPHIGFMQGTAGVLYTMIRLTEAGRSLPSVLSFDPVD
ncbi:lanthionine synthetase LanC family protein [Nocardioides sp. NPDC006273]|uniref:lanthionine synthetase LanC family protein n=1 Tax=Nocardioides sp. NPDC006273 TaxID=3155598 RepID=UPI0033AE212B